MELEELFRKEYNGKTIIFFGNGSEELQQLGQERLGKDAFYFQKANKIKEGYIGSDERYVYGLEESELHKFNSFEEKELNHKSIDEIIKLVEQWSTEREIPEKYTPKDQFDKTLEELIELKEALRDQSFHQMDFGENSQKNVTEIKDAIGNIIGTLIIQCQMQGFSLKECLNQHWNEIKDRKAKIINGQFVKEK